MAQIPLGTQFIAGAPNYPTTERRSAIINAESQAYTMQDIVDTVSAEIPAYKVYTALLIQSGTNNPTTIVLENTFGISFNWTRVADGNYQIQDFSNNPFTNNKTFGLCTISGGINNKILNFSQAFSSVVALSVLNPSTGANIDLNGTVQIEIRVYP
jgi:hypothetical protein